MKPIFSLLTCIMSAPIVLAQHETTSLSPILMYVADRQTADAAAPRIQSLIEREGVHKLKAEAYDLLLLRGTSCFGSTELQKVMRPFLPQPHEAELAEVKPFLAPLAEMWQAMDDIAVTLNTVKDKATADAAAHMLETFTPFMASCSEKLAALSTPNASSAQRELRMSYLTGKRSHAARLLQAWGALAQRNADYYESTRLIDGLLAVRDVLENMNMQVDPEAIPSVMKATRELRPVMQQWVAIISMVQDRSSADVAALQLTRLNAQMRDIVRNAGVSRSYEEDMFLFSPELEVMVHIMDRVTHYLQDEAKPAFFGSARLRLVLEHED